MFSIFEALLLSFFAIVALYLFNTYTYWKRRGVVHETPLPLFGNFWGIGRTLHLRDINHRIYQKFKNKAPFAGTYMFLSKAALIFDLELIKHVLIKDFSNFHDRGIFNNIKDDPLTGHLLTLEGEQWRAMRMKLTPVFTSARMKYMFPTIVQVGENFTASMTELLNASADGIFEIKELCSRYTTDVIGNCAFGIECNSLKDPQAEFRQKGRSIFAEPRHNPLLQAFIITNPDLARKMRMKFLSDSVSSFFLNVVRQTVEYRLKNNIKRNDFMDLLIEMKAKNEDELRETEGIDLSAGLTIEQMAAQTFVFFLAGFETSSTTMSFALYELAKNPEIQDQLRQEIRQVLKQNNGELTYESINSMVYLEQVIAETLRLYPVIPNLLRKTKSDYKLPNSSMVIEKGITIVIPINSIHYDAEYWPEPLEFRPSRFTAEEIENRHTATYLPFGDGPRNCIGSRFGKMQTKVGLVSLLSHFRFEFCALTEKDIVYDKRNIIVTPKHGIQLKVVPL